MQFILNNISYKTSLRWLQGSRISKNELNEFTEKFSNKGVFYKSNNLFSYGVIDKGDDLETNLPALAPVFADYKKNCIIFLKSMNGNEGIYWGCLISNGVPIIDFTSTDLDSVINPILKRLSEPGGDSHLYVDAPSLLVDKSSMDELENNAKFNQLLFARSGLVKLILNPNVLKVNSYHYIKKIKYGSNTTGIVDSLNKKGVLLIGLIFLAFGIFFSSEEKPIAVELKKSFSIPVKDYSSAIKDSFDEYIDGNDHKWATTAYRSMGSFKNNRGPFKKVSSTCLLREEICNFVYSRVGSRDYKTAIKALEVEELSFTLSLDAQELKIYIPMNLKSKKEINLYESDDFKEIRDLLYVRDDIKQRTDDVSFIISEPNVLSIGGKKGFFQNLSIDLKEKLSFFSYAVSISGDSRSHIDGLENDLKEFSNLMIYSISRDFVKSSGQSWIVDGEHLINIKKKVSKNEED
jgi:hypothetical protein